MNKQRKVVTRTTYAILPPHLVLHLLQFYPLQLHATPRLHRGSLFGYFKRDITRSIYLIFSGICACDRYELWRIPLSHTAHFRVRLRDPSKALASLIHFLKSARVGSLHVHSYGPLDGKHLQPLYFGLCHADAVSAEGARQWRAVAPVIVEAGRLTSLRVVTLEEGTAPCWGVAVLWYCVYTYHALTKTWMVAQHPCDVERTPLSQHSSPYVPGLWSIRMVGFAASARAVQPRKGNSRRIGLAVAQRPYEEPTGEPMRRR